MKLFMLSGGMASIASLKKYVDEFGNEDVIALHVTFGTAIRHHAEIKAVEEICSAYEVPLFSQQVDMIPVADFDMLVQCALAFHYHQKRVTDIYFGFTGMGAGKHYSLLFKWAEDYVKHLNTFDLGEALPKVTFRTNIDGMTRQELLEVLEGNTFWSCRQPIVDGTEFEPCGRCGNCREFMNQGIPHPTLGVGMKLNQRIFNYYL